MVVSATGYGDPACSDLCYGDPVVVSATDYVVRKLAIADATVT